MIVDCLRLPQRFFDTMRVGDIISRMDDALNIRAFLSETAFELILNAFLVIFAFAALFFYSWQLALFSLAIIPAILILMIFNNLINRKFQRKLMEKTADLESHLVESLSNQLSLRALHLQNWATLKTETRFVDLLRAAWQATIRTQFVSSSTNFVTQAYVIGLLWLGAGFGARFEDDRRRDDVVLHPLGLYCRAGHGVAQRQPRFAAGVDRGRLPLRNHGSRCRGRLGNRGLHAGARQRLQR